MLEKRVYTDRETVITADNLNDIQDSVIALESGVVACTAKGEAIAVTDSSSNELLGLNLYGKSTQAGTPTPDAPIDIVSVGDDGGISAFIYGKNMVSLSNGGYVIATGVADNLSAYQRTTKFHLPKGTKVVWRDSNGTTPTDVLQWKENGEYIGSYTYVNGGFEAAATDAYWLAINYYLGSRAKLTWCQLEIGNAATAYEAYAGQQTGKITLPLRGIPVTDKTLATYTDASGQMWCADEIDLERGVYIQRVKELVVSECTIAEATQGRYRIKIPDATTSAAHYVNNKALCSHLPWIAGTTLYNDTTLEGFCLYYESNAGMFVRVLSITSVEAMTEWLEGVTIIYCLQTPVEIALTDEEIATYKALHTNKPNTTVLNDSGAYMSMKYIADTKSYIDNKVSSIVTATVE